MQDEKSVNRLSELLGSDTWSNAACCGYILIACKTLGYTVGERRDFLEAVHAAFGNYTKQQAEKEYYAI